MARTTHFSFVFSKFFNLWHQQFLFGVGDREPRETKVAVEKPPKRAGATPLLTAFSRPKFCGVAPARPEPLGAVFCPHAYKDVIDRECCEETISSIEGENPDGSIEGTTQTIQDCSSPIKTRRRSKDQTRKIRAVSRLLTVVRCDGSA